MRVHLVISKPNIPGEENGQPVTPCRHVNIFGQLLQSRKATGLKVVSQCDMKLFLMGLNMNIWIKDQKEQHIHTSHPQ